jgi:ATP-dependent Clp protease ATP-binding subunit ClpA
VDCGEFHLEHEVAKLIGAPPGYLGHRETHPILTQSRLTSVTSRYSDLSIVLFDEIEKAAPSITRLLLGVLDKATLRLGDNTTVNFERSLIFMTSNLGANRMMKALERGFGFNAAPPIGAARSKKLASVGTAAVRRHFSPEFVNRIDATVTYEPLNEEVLQQILDLQIREMQEHISRRLGDRSFELDLRPECRRYLLEQGTSAHYGARHIRRTLQQLVMQPLASALVAGEIPYGSRVRVDYSKRKAGIVLKVA